MKYVPVLRWQTGEKKALMNLSKEKQSQIVPLFEFDDYEDLSEIESSIEKYFDRKIFLDTIRVDEGDRSYLRKILKFIIEKKLNIIPVLYYDDLNENSLVNKIKNDFDEILLRFNPMGLDSPTHNEIITELKEWSIENKASVNLLLDFGILSNERDASYCIRELKDFLPKLKEENFYKNIIVSSTSFPEKLSDILNSGESVTIQRNDVKIYEKTKEIDEELFTNKIIYSDYTVTRFTEMDLDFSKMQYGVLPKARYTTAESYKVLKGERNHTKKIWIKNYNDLAENIINSDYYYGEEFSFGDLDIKKRAIEEEGPGNHLNWVIIGVNHHIAVVLEQLSKSHDS